MFEPQAPFGDRPGLVRADIRDPADVLDGDRTPHQGLTLRHAIDTDPEEEGEDDRELLGDGGRGERDSADEGVEPAVSLIETHRPEGQAEDEGRDNEDFHQPADRRLQRRDLVRAVDRGPDDLTVERLTAGVGDADAGLAGQETGPGEHPVFFLHQRIA